MPIRLIRRTMPNHFDEDDEPTTPVRHVHDEGIGGMCYWCGYSIPVGRRGFYCDQTCAGKAQAYYETLEVNRPVREDAQDYPMEDDDHPDDDDDRRIGVNRTSPRRADALWSVRPSVRSELPPMPDDPVPTSPDATYIPIVREPWPTLASSPPSPQSPSAVLVSQVVSMLSGSFGAAINPNTPSPGNANRILSPQRSPFDPRPQALIDVEIDVERRREQQIAMLTNQQQAAASLDSPQIDDLEDDPEPYASNPTPIDVRRVRRERVRQRLLALQQQAGARGDPTRWSRRLDTLLSSEEEEADASMERNEETQIARTSSPERVLPHWDERCEVDSEGEDEYEDYEEDGI